MGMRRARPALRWLAALSGLAVFGLLLRATNLRQVAGVVQRGGPLILLAALPFLGAVIFDTWGWRRLMRVLDQRPPFLEVLRVRISLEALILTLPGGGVIAESAAPALLGTRCGMPIRDAVVSVAARRWITLRANAIYLVAGARVGYSLLAAQSLRVLGRPGLGVIALFLPLLPLGASLALEATFSRGSFAHALHRKLSQLPGRAGAWFASRGQAFAAVDEDFQRFGHGGSAVTPATLAYLGAWFMESVETWLILRLLGVDLSFGAVLGFEPALSLLRSAAFFLPAGLGAQDLGYVALLGGGPQAFAFVALKRLKELFWAAIGWALLVTGKSAVPVTPRAEACA
jgi:hypothetical protein